MSATPPHQQQQLQQQQEEPGTKAATGAASKAPGGGGGGGGGGAADAPGPRRLGSGELMSSMLTMLGGVEEGCYTGYAGQWCTWEVDLKGAPRALEPLVAALPGDAPHGVRLVDEAVNVRLWRPEGGGAIEQANLYQAPDKMAGSASTRFAPYLRADATKPGAIRPDGYGLRCWTFGPDSPLVAADCSGWAAAPPQPPPAAGGAAGAAAAVPAASPPPHKSMRVISVPGEAVAIVNGGLPPAFKPGQGDIWVLEFIFGEPGFPERRWATMNWFEDGALVVNRCINEDRVRLPANLSSHRLDPAALRAAMGPRRDAAAVVGRAGVDAYVCSDWGGGPGGGAPAAGGAKLAAVAGSGVRFTWDESLQLAVEELPEVHWGAARGGPGPSVEQVFPDCSYCRQPADLAALAAAGVPAVTFESGYVRRDGGVARWLLTYELQGRRLPRSAVYERYPAASEQWGA